MRVWHKFMTDLLIASSFLSAVTSFVTGCLVNEKLMSLKLREIGSVYAGIQFGYTYSISIMVFSNLGHHITPNPLQRGHNWVHSHALTPELPFFWVF